MEDTRNPAVVLDAVAPAPEKVGGVEIGELTILKYAYLEKIKSPFVDPSQEFSVEGVVPTVFVMAQPKEELRKYARDPEALKADALEWAEGRLSVQDLPKAVEAVASRLAAVNKAAPAGKAEPGKN